MTAAYNHAVKEAGLLEVNPVAHLKKATAFSRTTFFTEEEVAEVMDDFNQPVESRGLESAASRHHPVVTGETGQGLI